ncbi:LexA family protein [Polynucleobacter necessarius]|uniref:LexA family protein n=1 Tax=Polynucleobacter necessarius TaxID=576610 RepID=UPI0022B2548D|nr:S24 family peptidase [Polynucleobacter necessarius]
MATRLLLIRRSNQNTKTSLWQSLTAEYTIKRLYQLRGRVELQPENPNYQPITFNEGSELQIWGVVVGVVRKYSNASTRYNKEGK